MSRRPAIEWLGSLVRWLPVAVVAGFAIAGLAGWWLAPADPTAMDLGAARHPPSTGHLLGTDQLGRDELSRLVAGARGSVLAVVCVLGASLLVGAVLGVAAGWPGGVVDRAVLRLVDVTTGVPTLLLGLVLASLFGGSSLDVAVALAATAWPPYVRVIATETRVRRDDPSNQALRLLGAGSGRILFRHVLPALSGPVAVLAGLHTAEVILSVATLSFLGLGAQPPTPEWGSMLVDSQPYLLSAPWLFLAPAVAVTAVAASCTVLAERAGRWFSHGALDRPPAAVPRGQPDARLDRAGQPAAEALLEVRGLSVELGTAIGPVRVVDGVDLAVARGETLAVVGPSGSGKTMAMLGVLRLFPPTIAATVSGSVRFDGRELVGLDERALRTVRGRRIAYVPQDLGTALNPLRRVGAQIAAVARRHGDLGRQGARERAAELLGLVGLDEPERVARQRPGELSGGMRQRVLIAAALAGQPDLLIADEPTSALDATAAVGLVELLQQLQQRLGMAMIIVTHELGVAARLASQVAVFDQARVVEQAGLAKLLASPAHPTPRRLLAAAGTPAADGDMPVRRPAAEPPRPLLEVRSLRVTYPRRGRCPAVVGVGGVDLDLGAGEAVGVVGNSGCGKSSLARALVGLQPYATGSVLLRGRPVRPRDGLVRSYVGWDGRTPC